MDFIPAKSIVTRTKNEYWFGKDYNMNIYKGCCHGCIYCDSRSNCYGVDNFDTVRVKTNSIDIIRKELKGKIKKGVIGTGAMSDPYNPFEKQYKLTRQALELINTYGFGVAIDTKSTLITRDIDILKRINEHSPVIVKITITTCEDELCKIIEPNVALSSERFDAIKQLTDEGIYAGILLTPVLPFLEDNSDNIKGIIRLAHENGGKFIYSNLGVTLRQNQREWYYKKLDEYFPGLR
ncbi:radical SAM protein, partial [Clostridium sp.]|uniref:SPL family radical SAM protein n=1 Tax=Clostridium sp. TaxID=1506 RepID=UPI0025886CA5